MGLINQTIIGGYSLIVELHGHIKDLLNFINGNILIGINK